MTNILTEQDKKVVTVLQDGLPLISRPFQFLAEQLELTETELLRQIQDLINDGTIRRFGATLKHAQVGFLANAMVVWDVLEDKASECGRIMAGFKEVSHCYRRPRRPGWPYNLFTMIHGQSREYCAAIAEKISVATGVSDYLLLYSSTELKKSSMRYFDIDTDIDT